jgi:hypothetical protein
MLTFVGTAWRYFKCNNITPPRKRTNAHLAWRFGPSRDTHRKAIVCVEGNGARGWLSDDGEGSNNGAYHPGSKYLPNRVAF